MYKLKLYENFLEYSQQQLIDQIRIDEKDLEIYAKEVVDSLVDYYDIDFVKIKLEELVKNTITTVFGIHPNQKNPFYYIHPLLSDGDIKHKSQFSNFIPSVVTNYIANKIYPTSLHVQYCMDMISAYAGSMNSGFTWGGTRMERIKNCFDILKSFMDSPVNYPAYQADSNFICEYDDIKEELRIEGGKERYAEYISSSAERIFGQGWKISTNIDTSHDNNIKIGLYIINTNKK